MMKTSFDDELDLIPLDDEYFSVVDEELDLIPLDYEDQKLEESTGGKGSSFDLIENLFGNNSNQEISRDERANGLRQFSEEESPDQFLLEEEQPPATERSFAQQIANHPITQGLLGAAKYFTWPLDILKLAMRGEGLTDIDEIEEAFARSGQPFDRQDYINKVYELTESIPTQQFIEDLVKEKTGIDLAPKDRASKMIRQGAEILATGPKGLIREPAKQIAKKTAGAAAGAATSEGLKEIGAPETLADIVGFTLGGTAGGRTQAAKLSPEAEALTKIAEKHGLRKFEGIQREVAPKNAVVSPKKQAQLTQELSETSRQAIDKVIEGKLPIKKLRDSGVNLETAYTVAYNQANKTAKQFDLTSSKGVDLSDLLNFIKNKRQQIKDSAPSLSDVDKKVLAELNEQYRQLTTLPKKKPTILGPTGEPIPQPTKRIPKSMSAEQALDQYKNFNENVKGIYRKSQFTGAESEIKNLYGEMNSNLIQSIEKVNPPLAQELSSANRIFNQTSNLNLAEDIMSKAFKDGYNPKKLTTILGGKTNKAMLSRALGKDAVKDLVDISAYGIKAQEKVLSQLKNPKNVGQFLSEMSPLKLGLLSLKHGLNYKLYGLPLAYDISKTLIHRAQGNLFTRPATRKTYVNYLKHAISPESAAFKKASRELTSAIADEFGTEEEFLEMIEQEE